jgi:hypothetical protein
MHTRTALRKTHRGLCEPGTRNPCGRKGQERRHEEMDEVDPYQSQHRRTYEPPKVVVVYPNNGDEQIAHHIADDPRPRRPESRETPADPAPGSPVQ